MDKINNSLKLKFELDSKKSIAIYVVKLTKI